MVPDPVLQRLYGESKHKMATGRFISGKMKRTARGVKPHQKKKEGKGGNGVSSSLCQGGKVFKTQNQGGGQRDNARRK